MTKQQPQARKNTPLHVLLLCCLGSVCGLNARAATEPETANLSAAQFLSGEQMKGIHHTVREEVVNEGFTNVYRIDSPFGEFDAAGTAQVAVRVQEINAIAKLKEMSKLGVVAESAGDAVTRTAKTVGRAIDDPEGTLRGIPAGVGRLFKRTVRKTQDAYAKAKEMADEQAQKEAGAADDTGGKADASVDEDKVMEGGKKLAKSYFGVNSNMRGLARDLKVDPYTDNPVLRDELEKMARYAAAGSFGTKLIMPGFPAAVGYIADVSDLVYNTNALDLRLRNEEILRGMGASDDLIEAFFENKHYTPTTHTRVVVSLQQLSDVEGRSAVVGAAAQVESPTEARFYARVSELLAALHGRRAKLAEIVATESIPFANAEDGRVLLAAPVDHLRWTSSVAEAAAYLDPVTRGKASKRETWLEGTLSPAARTELSALGWEVFDRAFERLK